MTSANREALAYVVETTENTIPGTPTGQLLNFTGSGTIYALDF